MPKLYGFSGSQPAADQQLSAPAPSMPMDSGAGSLHEALQLDADGFPAGTPAGLRATMTPQEYMLRHSAPQQPMYAAIAAPQQSPANAGPILNEDSANKFQQGFKNVR